MAASPRASGKPKAARAVGGALNRNPVPIVVPCHRIVGSSGSLVGYAGGLERKQTAPQPRGSDPRLGRFSLPRSSFLAGCGGGSGSEPAAQAVLSPRRR